MTQAIARVIEVKTTDTLIVGTGTINEFTLNPSQTLFPNVLALLADLNDQANPDYTIQLNSDYKTRIQGIGFTGPVTGTLAIPLGFDGTEEAAPSVSAYSPEHMWIPALSSSDTNWFREDPGEGFKGQNGPDGNLSGISYDSRKKRQVEWPWIISTNITERASSGTTFQAERCFDRVIMDARKSITRESASSNITSKGVYFIECLEDYTGLGNLPTSWDSGVANSGNYLYCSPGLPEVKNASDAKQNGWYDVSCLLTSAVAPVWTWDITP